MDEKVQQYKNKKPGLKEIMKGYIFKWKKENISNGLVRHPYYLTL